MYVRLVLFTGNTMFSIFDGSYDETVFGAWADIG